MNKAQQIDELKRAFLIAQGLWVKGEQAELFSVLKNIIADVNNAIVSSLAIEEENVKANDGGKKAGKPHA